MSPQDAMRLVGKVHQPRGPVERAREQARFQTDKSWGNRLIAIAEREARKEPT